MSKTRLVQIVLLIAGIAIAVNLYFKYRVAPDIAFPTLKLKTMDGAEVKISDYRGKVIFLNFWATWCGDCIREMPSIIKAQEQLKNDSIVFLFVSDETAEKVKAFDERKGYGLNYLLSAQTMHELEINAIPTTYLIGKDGKVKFTKVGRDEWDSPDMIGRIRGYCK
ncbi:MAG: thiol:disulfide interchange protein TlpA [Bacteroidetes bacterium]|nr:MAG: thiol:disulfide interchange protein TlpA [Bacteroidota bacterium]